MGLMRLPGRIVIVGRIARAAGMKEGRIKYREDVVDGLENTPRAFLRLPSGENFGKQRVHVEAGRG